MQLALTRTTRRPPPPLMLTPPLTLPLVRRLPPRLMPRRQLSRRPPNALLRRMLQSGASRPWRSWHLAPRSSMKAPFTFPRRPRAPRHAPTAQAGDGASPCTNSPGLGLPPAPTTPSNSLINGALVRESPCNGRSFPNPSSSSQRSKPVSRLQQGSRASVVPARVSAGTDATDPTSAYVELGRGRKRRRGP